MTEASLRAMRKIDPTEIYGFPNDGTSAINIHPDFRQPRIVINKRIIEQVMLDKEVVEPVRLHLHTDGSVVVVDGFSRLTGIANLYAEGNTDIMVPFIHEAGSTNHIRIIMLRYNAEGAQKTPLSELEMGLYLLWCDEQGISEKEQIAELNKVGIESTKYIRSLKAVAKKPDVAQAFVKEDLDLASAKIVSRISDPDEREDVLNKVKQLKNEGLADEEIRQKIGLKKPNRGTRTFPDVFETLVKEIYLEVIAVTQRSEENDDEVSVMHSWNMIMWFLRQDGLNFNKQIKFVKENCNQEQLEYINANSK